MLFATDTRMQISMHSHEQLVCDSRPQKCIWYMKFRYIN